MSIENTLIEIEQKHLERIFSPSDAETLIDLVTKNVCHLGAQLRLIEYAFRFWRFFPKAWIEYYHFAINENKSCWKPEELSEIYLLGASQYYYDQNILKQREALQKAFELSPNNWKVVISYLAKFRGELNNDFRLELINRIAQLKPDHARAYFFQARYFEEYASLVQDNQYLERAIEAYKEALKVNLEPQHGIPSKALNDEIKRLGG